jgi:hypothetical protein
MPVQSTIKLRRDTAANWTSNNPTLAAGEIGVETDTGKFKIGDGSTAWTSLAYIIENFPIDSLSDVVIDGTPANNEVLAYDTATGKWINKTAAEAGLANNLGYAYRLTLRYNSSGTFEKAGYGSVRAVRVRCLGGGGGGGGAATTTTSQNAVAEGGTGGNYAESFLLVSELETSMTVTVGSGGAGAVAGANSGTDGGDSSFGTLVVARGGNGGGGATARAIPDIDAGSTPFTTGNVGDFLALGEATGPNYMLQAADGYTTLGGRNYLYPNPAASVAVTGGSSGSSPNSINRGVGGSGGANMQSQAFNRAGGNGIAGVVFLDLYT